MNRGNCYTGIDYGAVQKIRFQANHLSNWPEFRGWDKEDLEQEMMCDLFRRLPKFNPKKACFGTFTDRVVNHCALSLREKTRTKKRGFGQQKVNIDISTMDEDDPTHTHWRGCTENPTAHMELTIDINTVIGSLPEELSRICQLLKFHSVVDVCQQTGIPRATLYRRLAVIREHFLQAGFNKKCETA